MKNTSHLVTLKNTVNEKGESQELNQSPFIWEIDNRDAFKIVGQPFTKLAQMKRLPVQHEITLNTEEKKFPNGNSFYLPQVSLDTTKTIELTDEDQKMFSDFLSWIKNYNEYIMKEWEENTGKGISKEDEETVNDFIDIDNNDVA